MDNVQVKENGKGIAIEIPDREASFGPSGSGKTVIVASTRGPVKVGGVFVSVNAYRK